MSKKDKIIEQFKNGHNCSQSILTGYAEDLGLENHTALKIATGFGGGFGRSGETCGAVTGAFMVLGLKHGQSSISEKEGRAKTQESVRNFISDFKEKHGALNCKDLLGCDISTEEGFKESREKRELCYQFVETAAELTEKYLNKEC